MDKLPKEQRQIWTMDDICEYLGVGRKKATEILNRKGCPVIPRDYKGKYYVRAGAFKIWFSQERIK